MSTNFYRVLLIALAITFLGAAVFAQAPRLINYQGRVLDNTGAPVADGNHTFDFRIYTAATGGTLKWSELGVSIATTDGLFTHALGSVNPYSGSLFDNDTALYLDVAVDGQAQSPRTRLISVPYAQTAEDINGRSAYGDFSGLKTFSASSMISTYGRDGLEQIRLWGDSWGEIQLHDNQPTNMRTVVLTANDASGGQLSLRNPSGITTIDLHGGQTGNTSVDFPNDAIYDQEILDEPGITNKIIPNLYTSLTSSAVVAVDSIDITIPTSGYVEVAASGYVNLWHRNGTRTQVAVGLDKGTTTLAFGTTPGIQSMQIPQDIVTGTVSWHMPFSTTRVYSENAGTHRYYFLAKRYSGVSNNTAVSYPIMSAKFFPTAYGAIAKVASGENPIELSSSSFPSGQLNPVKLTNIRIQTLEEINAKQAAEMEELRIENERLRQIEEASRAGTAQGQASSNQQ